MLVTARVHVKKFVIQCTIQWVHIFLGIGYNADLPCARCLSH